MINKEQKQERLNHAIKLVKEQGIRIKKMNDEVWGDFRQKFLKEAKPELRKTLSDFWNLY